MALHALGRMPPAGFTLDLPVPPSVNRTRTVNWQAQRKIKAWEKEADGFVIAAKSRHLDPLRLSRIPRFELSIIVSEDHTNIDLDNGLKALIDYLRRIELIADDAKKNMRRVTIEWGLAPQGVRVIVTPL